MEISIEKITKVIGMIAAMFATIGGGYTAWDKIGGSFKKKDILTWSPEHFEISSAPAAGEFKAIVARQKHRNDCAVEDFKLEVRDSQFIVHEATPSVAKFSGAASGDVEKFGFTFKLNNPSKVAKGTAMLMAQITYKCPEGAVIVSYPNHVKLTFDVK